MNEKSVENKSYPICKIEWLDAAYSYEENLFNFPLPNLTIGILFEDNPEFIVIATNSKIGENGELIKVDGLIIPQKTIKKFDIIGFYGEK